MIFFKIVSYPIQHSLEGKKGTFLCVPKDFSDKLFLEKEQEITDKLKLLKFTLEAKSQELSKLDVLAVVRFSELKFRSFFDTSQQQIMLRSDVDIVFICTKPPSPKQEVLRKKLIRMLHKDQTLMLDFTFITQLELDCPILDDISFAIRRKIKSENILWGQSNIDFIYKPELADSNRLDTLTIRAIGAVLQISNLLLGNELSILQEDDFYKFALSLAESFITQNNLAPLPLDLVAIQQITKDSAVLDFAEFVNNYFIFKYMYTDCTSLSLEKLQPELTNFSKVHLHILSTAYSLSLTNWQEFLSMQLLLHQSKPPRTIIFELAPVIKENAQQRIQRIRQEDSAKMKVLLGLNTLQEKRLLLGLITPFFLYYNELKTSKDYEEIVRIALAIPKDILDLPDGFVKKQILFLGYRNSLAGLGDLPVPPIIIRTEEPSSEGPSNESRCPQCVLC